jgi:hypothetical protein
MAFTFYPAVAIFAVLVNEECYKYVGGQMQICYEVQRISDLQCGSEMVGGMKPGEKRVV